MAAVAKLFWTGNSQAIRLPKAFRFLDTDKVRIEREGNKIIIEPIVDDWDWLETLGEPDLTLEEAIQSARMTEKPQERDWSCFE